MTAPPPADTDVHDTAPPASDATGARERRGRARRIASWSAVALIGVTFIAWLVLGKNPALSTPDTSWQSEDFVEQPIDSGVAEQKPTWVVWDQPEGAWASVVVQNTRPYPVTVSPSPATSIVEVQVAAIDPVKQGGLISPQHVTAVPHLRVPAGGYLVVLMHVSEGCETMDAGSAAGTNVATVNVSTFGITQSVDVPFPGTYMAGTTTGHAADPTCASA